MEAIVAVSTQSFSKFGNYSLVVLRRDVAGEGSSTSSSVVLSSLCSTMVFLLLPLETSGSNWPLVPTLRAG